MIHDKRIFSFGFLLVISTFFPFVVYAQGQRQLVMDCKGGVSTCPHSQGCQCRKWIIKLLDRYGTEWGQIRGNNLESVKKQLESSQKWEENDANFFDIPNKGLYSNPSDPICDACTNPPKRSRDVETAYTIVEKVFGQWVGKLSGMRNKLLLSEVLKVRTGSAGGVLKDYAKALSDAQVKLQELEKRLTFTLNRETSFLGYSDSELVRDLNLLKMYIEGEEESIDREYNALPRDIRELLGRTGTAN